MKRTTLRRRAWLKRTRMVRRRRSTAYARRPRDLAFLGWVKLQRCLVALHTGLAVSCAGPIEADHAGDRGYGEKCPDSESIPLCRAHHRARTDSRGFFALAMWPGETDANRKLARREWIDARIAETQLRYLESGGVFLEDAR